jgi:hypothetical protein
MHGAEDGTASILSDATVRALQAFMAPHHRTFQKAVCVVARCCWYPVFRYRGDFPTIQRPWLLLDSDARIPHASLFYHTVRMPLVDLSTLILTFLIRGTYSIRRANSLQSLLLFSTANQPRAFSQTSGRLLCILPISAAHTYYTGALRCWIDLIFLISKLGCLRNIAAILVFFSHLSRDPYRCSYFRLCLTQ